MTKNVNTVSEAESLVMSEKEVVSRPLSWRVNEPYVDEYGDVAVVVYYYLHNGTKTEGGEKGQMEFHYEQDEFTPILKQVTSLDAFTRVQELGRLSSVKDMRFKQLNIMLCKEYDNNPSTDRKKIYDDVHDFIFHDKKCIKLFRSMVKAETLLNLLKRPAVFYSEEIQMLFA